MILTPDVVIRQLNTWAGNLFDAVPVNAAGWDIEFPEAPGYRFFIDHRPRMGEWVVSELSSGHVVVREEEYYEAISQAKEALHKVGLGRFAAKVAEKVAKYGELNTNANRAVQP